MIRSYLDTVLALPWNKSSHTKPNLKRAQAVLERDHYGLQRSKNEFWKALQFVHCSRKQPDKSYVL
ncbi:MAG: hypothetical protein ACLT3Y_01210 [Ruminococcus callidus]